MKHRILFFVAGSIMLLIQSCTNQPEVTGFSASAGTSAQQDIQLLIHIRGVPESNISLVPLTGIKAGKPLVRHKEVVSGQTDTLLVPADFLPGEFMLRFDFPRDDGARFSCERHLVLSRPSLELWINPACCNDEDSAWFQGDETENTVYRKFIRELAGERKSLVSLRDEMVRNDRAGSTPDRKSYRSYEKRRKSLNRQINQLVNENRTWFISRILEFGKIPEYDPQAAVDAGIQPFTDSYFNAINLTDSLIIKTTGLKDWVGEYLELCIASSPNDIPRDSVLIRAGVAAMEKARLGHPLVYGWFFDYFYDTLMDSGVAETELLLQKYFEDPGCMAMKKVVLQQRLYGMQFVTPGEPAPDFEFIDQEGNAVMFHDDETAARFKLIAFWNTDCWICNAFMRNLYSWYRQYRNRNDVEVYTVCLVDETQSTAWMNETGKMPGWKHMRDEGGNNSEVANAYCVMSTPLMILVDSRSKQIVALPNNTESLQAAMEQAE